MMTSLFSRSERNSTSKRWRCCPATFGGTRLALALLFLLPLALGAQERVAEVHNETEGLVAFVLLPQEEWESRGRVLWNSDPAGLFQRTERSLQFVPSGGVRGVALSGSSTLLGYRMDPDRSDWELLRLSASPGERITVSERSLSGRRLPSDQLPALPGPILLDGRYADWEKVSPLSAIPRRYEPRRFIRERQGEREVTPISVAGGWGTGGTRVRELKAASSAGVLYLFLSWTDRPTPETSTILYLYGEQEGRPVGTILIEGDVDRGALRLSRPGGAETLTVGNYVRRGNALESEIRRFPGASELRFVVVSTLYRGERWYEEFPITRVELDDLLN